MGGGLREVSCYLPSMQPDLQCCELQGGGREGLGGGGEGERERGEGEGGRGRERGDGAIGERRGVL